jgi:hypothetical protein
VFKKLGMGIASYACEDISLKTPILINLNVGGGLSTLIYQ